MFNLNDEIGQLLGGLEIPQDPKTKWVSDYRSRYDDSNGPRIVQIGAFSNVFDHFKVLAGVALAA